MKNKSYYNQADLLLQILPYVAKEKCFALKGGTAINMFVWDMPRLSVDIDLTYLPFDDRKTALANIANALKRIKEQIEATMPSCIVGMASQSDGQEAKLYCQTPDAQIKIEVNTVMRGHIFLPQKMDVSEAVEHEFGHFVSMNIISKAELFGGKICAALDRQHPRDLFDIYHLLQKGGISKEVWQGFIICLLSNSRPINEIINPNQIDQKHAFETQFSGMTKQEFTYQDFEATRKQLIVNIHNNLAKKDCQLLLSFKAGKPNWDLFPYENLKNLPAVKWKLENILKLKKHNPEKHQEQYNRLEKVLDNKNI